MPVIRALTAPPRPSDRVPSSTASSAGRRSPAPSTTGAYASRKTRPERALPAVAIGRANWTFGGSDRGGERTRRHLNPDRNGRPTGLARRRPQATTGPSCPTRRRPAPLDLRALASIPAAAFTGRTRLISPIDYSNYEFICTAGSVPPNGVTRQAESPMGRIDSPRLTVAFSGPIKGP
jgi:hypothetical protein